MNKEHVIAAVRQQAEPEQVDTMLQLGAALTVAARAAYPAVSANIDHLVGFNEMQHRLYGWLRHPQTGDEYPVEQLLEGLFTTAAQHGIDGELSWAFRTSLPKAS